MKIDEKKTPDPRDRQKIGSEGKKTA